MSPGASRVVDTVNESEKFFVASISKSFESASAADSDWGRSEFKPQVSHGELSQAFTSKPTSQGCCEDKGGRLPFHAP